jgi:23S rRNA (cytidine1920-2'-O)/16S rRNA (cytidine1409-2'-O)-methyltransferase
MAGIGQGHGSWSGGDGESGAAIFWWLPDRPALSWTLFQLLYGMITAMARKQRLDLVLVERGLAISRQQAQQLIRAGRVRSADRVLDKPGLDVLPDLDLEVQQPQRYVSRGGEKLEAALAAFPIAIAGRVCVDGGISTGGFTDCLLQRGAARVYGVDVGYGQTAWSLRSDVRVTLRERTNLRYLTAADLYGPDDPVADLAVADVSFISLILVLPALLGLLRCPQNGPLDLVVLVKPQFEVGKGRVGKGGVVRDPGAHSEAIAGVVASAQTLGLRAAGLVASPITGPAGNHEYLLWLQGGSDGMNNQPTLAVQAGAIPDATPGSTVQREEIEALVATTLGGHP